MTDFGGKLREARERRGITLRQIANTTKISVAVLEALERNDISKLPGGIFGRAFVRSYAIEVGLDPDDTVRGFLERFQGETAAPVAARQPVPDEESAFESQQRMAGVLLKLVLVSVPLAAALLYFTLRARPRADQPASAPAAAAPAAAAPASAAPTAVTPGAVAPAADAGARQASPALPADLRSGVMRLEIHPTAPCWVVLTVDGERVFAREMQAGERVVRDVRDAAVIEVGDAGAFAYTIDGRPGRTLGAAGEVTKARITRETVAAYVR